MNRILKTFAVVAAAATLSFAGGFNLGGHAAGTFGTWWGDDSDDAPWGLGFNAGLAGKIAINDMFSVAPEVDIALRRISDDDVTFREWALEIPVMARINVLSQLYLELGPTFAFNLSSEAEEDIEEDGYSYSATLDMDDYTNTFEFGLAVGAGYTVIPNLDINFRFALGLTSIIDEVKDYDDYTGESYSYEQDVKNMQLMIGATYWFL